MPQYIVRNPHYVKLLQILAYAKNEDTSVVIEEYTFGKITTNTSLCQKQGYLRILIGIPIS